jgi:hypothetical protein
VDAPHVSGAHALERVNDANKRLNLILFHFVLPVFILCFSKRSWRAFLFVAPTSNGGNS